MKVYWIDWRWWTHSFFQFRYSNIQNIYNTIVIFSWGFTVEEVLIMPLGQWRVAFIAFALSTLQGKALSSNEVTFVSFLSNKVVQIFTNTTVAFYLNKQGCTTLLLSPYEWRKLRWCLEHKRMFTMAMWKGSASQDQHSLFCFYKTVQSFDDWHLGYPLRSTGEGHLCRHWQDYCSSSDRKFDDLSIKYVQNTTCITVVGPRV